MVLTGSGIFYEQFGAGESVLFLHGATLDGTMWSAQVGGLLDHYSCLTVDRRGHGRSGRLTDGYDPVVDLVEVLESAGIPSCHVVGQSLGGSDALALAGRHPERVRSLVLVDAWLPIPEMTWSPPWRVVAEKGVEEGRRAWLSDKLFASLDRRPEARAAVHAMVERSRLSLWAERVKKPEPLPPSAVELAAAVAASTLVVVGEHDLPPFHAVAAWLQQRIPGTQNRPVATVPGAGHMLPIERPEELNRLLSEWFEQAAE